MKTLKSFFVAQKKLTEGFLSLAVAVLFLFFFSSDISLLSSLDVGIPKHVFVLLFATFLGIILSVLIISTPHWDTAHFWVAYERLLRVTLPGVIVLILCLTFAKGSPILFQLGAGLYVILGGVYLFHRYCAIHTASSPAPTVRSWLRNQGQATLLLVIVFTSIFFLAGLYRLTEFAAVDEPLWLEGRIGKYWNNIGEGDWDSTDISDKPGITIALATGIGLIFKDQKDFDTLRYQPVEPGLQSGLERHYLAFRFPLLLVIVFLLPFFYFLLERLSGKTAALISYGFIATSPVLIGMSKIINPDSLLWLLVPLSLLSYLLFLKNGWYRYLVIAGIFFGLALLTKYVANILLIFLFVLMFVEYLYHPGKNTVSFSVFAKKALSDLFFYLFFALAVFYLLLPAVWVEPMELIESTILSQAFEKVAPFFLLILILLFCDQYFNRSRLVSAIMGHVGKAKYFLGALVAALFLVGVILTMANTWTGMKMVNFMELLESPKNIATQTDFLVGYLTNFYPFVFGIVPLALLGLVLTSLFLFRRNFWTDDRFRLSFYLILFILLYYFGGTVNGVAAIVRYQIILFPLAGIIAGITLAETFSQMSVRLKRSLPDLTVPIIVLFSGIGILVTTPFPLSYASSLLPDRFYTDLKDMGPGSYEIAQQLNALPNAKDIVIWTDKDGVCKFFLGVCRRGFSSSVLPLKDYDYIVVSSTRENRTSGMILMRLDTHPEYLPLHTYYRRDDPAMSVYINGRPSHFVKAFAYPKQ